MRCGGTPAAKRPGDLAAGDRVGAQPRLGKQPDHGEIAVGLDRVAEQHPLAAERVQEAWARARMAPAE